MRRISRQPIVYIVLIFTMMAVFGVGLIVSRGRLKTTLNELEKRKAELKAASSEVAALQEEQQYVMTASYVERAARDHLGFIYPGEVRYVGD